MKITGCRINYGPSAKRELFDLLPRSIERMISANKDQNFDFKTPSQDLEVGFFSGFMIWLALGLFVIFVVVLLS